MANSRICSVEGCGKTSHARGFCGAHYMRRKRYGDPLSGRTSKGEPERFFKEVVLPYDGDDCLIWPYATNGNGYGKMQREGNDQIVSRILCEILNGPPPAPTDEAAHVCGWGRFGCVTKRHLKWKTRDANQADRLIHGTHNRGERCGTSKLTESEVREIRALKGKIRQRDLAEKFGVSVSTVGAIHKRQNWSWL